MTTVTIDEKTVKGKKLVEYLKTLVYVKFNQSNLEDEFRQSVKELKTGKIKPINQLFNEH
jgi:uncharacterized protein YbjQ (UPF0145 family)